MREFVVYTLLRLGLFAGALAITFGVWDLLADGVWLPGALILAFIVSGVASLVLLDGQREAFAQRVQTRAEKASRAFEEMRAREDADGTGDPNGTDGTDGSRDPGAEGRRRREPPA